MRHVRHGVQFVFFECLIQFDTLIGLLACYIYMYIIRWPGPEKFTQREAWLLVLALASKGIMTKNNSINPSPFAHPAAENRPGHPYQRWPSTSPGKCFPHLNSDVRPLSEFPYFTLGVFIKAECDIPAAATRPPRCCFTNSNVWTVWTGSLLLASLFRSSSAPSYSLPGLVSQIKLL